MNNLYIKHHKRYVASNEKDKINKPKNTDQVYQTNKKSIN